MTSMRRLGTTFRRMIQGGTSRDLMWWWRRDASFTTGRREWRDSQKNNTIRRDMLEWKRKQSRRKRREKINLIELSLLKCSLRSTEKIAFWVLKKIMKDFRRWKKLWRKAWQLSMHYISLIKLQYIQLRHNFSSLHTKKGTLSSSFAKTWQVPPSKK